MARKVPIRKCVGCGERRPKQELIRIVYSKTDDKLMIDHKGKLPGRGAYLCANPDCLQRARKGNRLAGALKISIPNEIYNKLMEEIDTMRG